MPIQVGSPTISAGNQTNVAEALAQWSAQKRQEKTQKNLRQAYESGTQADVSNGLPEEVKPKFGLVGRKTLEQYNKGVRDAYVLSIDRDNTEEIARIANEADGNLDSYQTVSDKYKQTVLANVDPAVSGLVKTSLESMISRGFLQVQQTGIDRQQKHDREERELANKAYLDEASRLTRNGQFKGASENLLKSRSTLDSMVESGDISQEEANTRFTAGKKEVYFQGHKREVLDIAQTDVDEADKKLNEIESEIPNDWAPHEWESAIDNIRADVNRIRTKVAAKSRASLARTKQSLKDYKQSVELGFKIDDVERSEIASMVAGTDLQDDFAQINKIEVFSVMPVKDRDAIVISAMNAETIEGQKNYIALNTANERLKEMAKEDPFGLAVRQGIVEATPFSLDDFSTLAPRIEAKELIKQAYGIENASPFTDQEVGFMVRDLDTMTSADKSQLALSLSPVPEVWEQIDKKGAGVFAMAGAIGSDDITTRIFKGQELIQTKQAKYPSFGDYEPIVDKIIGEVDEVYGVEDRQNIIKAALDYYVMDNQDGSNFDSGDFKKALKQITGGIAKVNGFKIEVPRGATEDQIKDYLTELHPDILSRFGGQIYPIETIRSSQFKSIGNGVFRVMQDGSPIQNASGAPLEIQFTPELYLENESLTAPTARKRSR